MSETAVVDASGERQVGQRRRGLHITARDLRILEDLTVRRAETLDWLHARHFTGLSRKRALNRLGDLCAHGYLLRVPCELPWDGTRVSAYTLGPKAKRAIILRSLAAEHFLHRRWNPTLREDCVPHQLAVNRVADWIGADLRPEHLLEANGRAGARHRPDGVYQLATHTTPPGREDGLVALEVDLGHYSRRRLVEKTRAFLAGDGLAHVLIVCPSGERALQIRGWLTSESQWIPSDRITIITLQDARDDPNALASLRPAPPRAWYAMPDLTPRSQTPAAPRASETTS